MARRPLPGRKRAQVAILTPGSHPIEALADVLARAATHDPVPLLDKAESFLKRLKINNQKGEWDGLRRSADTLPEISASPLIVLVDQFEEVYSLCKDIDERQAFIENLLDAAGDCSGRVSVIIILRSDFLGETQKHTTLSKAITDKGFIVSAMSKQELERAIARPAEVAGRPLEKGTIDQLIEQTEGREGALPLLQFALTRIWEGLRDGIDPAITLEDIGGVGGALAAEAQRIFDSLTAEEQAIARRVFLGLVQLGEGAKDTRRRVDIENLVSHKENLEQVKKVVARFAERDIRLITLSGGDGTETAEVTHEALFDHWGQLNKWLDGSRDDIRFQRRLEDAACHWDENERPEGSLWRPPDLDLLRRAQKQIGNDLTSLQMEFFQASDIAEKTRKRQRNLVLLGLNVGIVLITTFGLIAYQNVQEAQRQQQIALSRHLAANAELLKSERPNLSLLLSAEAVRVADTPEARRSLLAWIHANSDITRFLHHTGTVNIVEFSPDGTVLAAGGDKGVSLWDLSSGRLIAHFEHQSGSTVLCIAFSPEGSTLVSGARDGSIEMWNFADGKRLGAPLRAGVAVNSLALSNDGMTLASGLASGDLLLWNTSTREKLGATFGDSQLPITSIAFDPFDEQHLLAAGIEGVQSWNVATRKLYGKRKKIPAANMALSRNGRFIALSEFGETQKRVILFDRLSYDQFVGEPPEVVAKLDVADNGKVVSSSFKGNVTGWLPYEGKLVPRTLSKSGRPTTSVAISPDGKTLASTIRGSSLVLWNPPGTPKIRQHLSGAPPTSDLAFRSEAEVVVAGANGTIMIWDMLAAEPTSVFSIAPDIADEVMACSADAAVVGSIGKDKGLYLWDIAQRETIGGPLTGHGGQVVTLAISSDKTRVAAGTKDGKVFVWKDASAEPNASLLTEFSDQVEGLAFSPDGSMLAISPGDLRYSISLWDVTTGNHIGEMQPGHTFPIRAMAFNPDGKILVTGSWDKTIRFLEVATMKVLGPPLTGHEGFILDLAFSPDGNTLASAGEHVVIIWDIPTSSLLGHLFTEDQYGLHSVAFSPDGRYLAAGGQNVAYVWDLSIDEWKKIACNIANRSLTDSEWKAYLGTEDRQEMCNDLRLTGPLFPKK